MVFTFLQATICAPEISVTSQKTYEPIGPGLYYPNESYYLNESNFSLTLLLSLFLTKCRTLVGGG